MPENKKRTISNIKLSEKSYKNLYYKEAKLHKWLIENELLVNKIFNIDILDSEVCLPGALDSLKREIHLEIWNEPIITNKRGGIGRIDLLFRYKGINYCCEIKCQPFRSNDFWEALKVVGYTAYYNWLKDSNFQSAVLIPKKSCKLEHFIVSSKLRLKIFSFTEDKYGGYKIEEAKAESYKAE